MKANPGDDIRNVLIGTLPNLQYISDETMGIARCQAPLPLRMQRIDLVLGKGPQLPSALPIRRLRALHIEPPSIGTCESISISNKREFDVWPLKIQRLLSNPKELDELTLSVTPMSTCGCTHSKEPPAIKDRLGDLLGTKSPALKLLTLNVPWLSFVAGSLRYAHFVRTQG